MGHDEKRDPRPNLGLLAKIEGLLCAALVVPWCIVLLLTITIVALLRPRTDLYYTFARVWIAGGLFLAGTRVITEGAEQLEADKHYVVMANHRSHFDCFAIPRALFHLETRWVGKVELTKIPFLGRAIQVTGQILIDRKNRGAAIAELRRSMEQRGCTVVFFPEGSRARGTQLMPFKKGAVAFAMEAGLPVVPVVVSGSEKVMPRQSLLIRSATVRVKVGAPIDVSEVEESRRGEVTEHIRVQMDAMLATLEPGHDSGDGGTGG